FHHAMQAVFGVRSHIDGVPVHGNTDLGIVRAVLAREGIPSEVLERERSRLIETMCAEVASKAGQLAPEVCPSIVELLTLLRERGKLLGVVSGNLERIGWLKLEASGLREFFEFGSFSDAREQREEIFRAGIAEARGRRGETARVCVVGDTPADIRAARASGVPILALATGTFPLEELRGHGPDACFGCCTDLLAAG
ncbi:MAG TPA: HAD hydrolase-like protein, partial [Terriglobales bacterium]|nr:HAD hydrolase-like protein [Terriglobales bacterium]